MSLFSIFAFEVFMLRDQPLLLLFQLMHLVAEVPPLLLQILFSVVQSGLDVEGKVELALFVWNPWS